MAVVSSLNSVLWVSTSTALRVRGRRRSSRWERRMAVGDSDGIVIGGGVASSSWFGEDSWVNTVWEY